MKFTRHLLLVAAVLLFLPSCVKTVENIGYTFDKDAVAGLKAGETRKAQVLNSLGSPSAKSTFGAETWYYISSEHESIAFLRPKIKSQRVVAIVFDEAQLVSDIREYDVKDARAIALSADVTETEGHDLGMMEQLLGNVGRFNSDGSSGKKRKPNP